MSKAQLLRILSVLALVFAYIAAANSPSCVEWNPGNWFQYCTSDLPARLGVLILGFVFFLALTYFADKERRKDAGGHVVKGPIFHDNGQPYSCGGCEFKTRDPAAARAHEDSFVRGGLGTVANQRIGGSQTASPGTSQSGEVRHSFGRVVSDRVEQAQTAYGFEPEGRAGAIPMPASRSAAAPDNGRTPAVATTPTHKTCPDCAEEVRAAARKCRFCGYIFEESA